MLVIICSNELTYDVIQTFLQELFSTNKNQNEKIINLYKSEKNVKTV